VVTTHPTRVETRGCTDRFHILHELDADSLGGVRNLNKKECKNQPSCNIDWTWVGLSKDHWKQVKADTRDEIQEFSQPAWIFAKPCTSNLYKRLKEENC